MADSGPKPTTKKHKEPEPAVARDIIALLRDLTFPITLLLYVTGFTYQERYLELMQIPVSFATNSPLDFAYWAEAALAPAQGGVSMPHIWALLFMGACFLSAIAFRSYQPGNVLLRRIMIFLLLSIGFIGGIAFLRAASRDAAFLEFHRQMNAAAQLTLGEDGLKNQIELSSQDLSDVTKAGLIPALTVGGAATGPAGTTRSLYLATETADSYYILVPAPDSDPTTVVLNKSDLRYYKLVPKTSPPLKDSPTPSPQPHPKHTPSPTADQLGP